MVNLEILILDDLFFVVDVKIEVVIIRNIRENCKGKMIFILIYCLFVVEYVDLIFVMDGGVIFERGMY